ncbi:MAG TPA: hypothetical protein VGV88_09820 [Candidatus Dormibacteraeota bacterium]|nr:hypothetical protein [Candidatus Dormibacteraeota bacterium]
MPTARSESDLRSLERARMYTIFKPLDAEEPLTREQLLAARRFRSVGRWELAGAIWLPLLVAILVLSQWTHAPAAMALAAMALTFLALLAFALAGDRLLRLK